MSRRNRLLEHIYDQLEKHGEISADLFECPITGCIMHDPVLAADGATYERRAITMWLSMNGARSPITQQIIPCSLVTDHTLRSLIVQKCGQGINEYHVPPEVCVAQLCQTFDRLVSSIESIVGENQQTRLRTVLSDLGVAGPRLLGLPHMYDPFIPFAIRECTVRQSTASRHLGWVVQLALGGMRSSWPGIHEIIRHQLAQLSGMVHGCVQVAFTAASKPLSTETVKGFQALLMQGSGVRWADWWLATQSVVEACVCPRTALDAMGRLELLYMDVTETGSSTRTRRWLNRSLCRVLSLCV